MPSSQYYLQEPACSGRSMHQLAAAVTRDVEQARTTLAKFFNAAKKEEIVFTRNTTEAINLVANSLGLKSGDVVLISDKEHNSNLIPWQSLAKKQGVRVKILPSRAGQHLRPGSLREAARRAGEAGLAGLHLQPGRRHASRPKRSSRRPTAPGRWCCWMRPRPRRTARSTSRRWTSISWPSRPTRCWARRGWAMLYGKYALLEKMEPFLVGGDTVASSTYDTCEFLPPPEKFEAGLQDYAGILGMGAAAKYLQDVGFDAIQKQETLLNDLHHRRTC